ncbi:MAG: plastocyanin/azurin family copper-binding protein [Candidatus Sulfopaludibacter sp.]|nr:plastocyanin/azurin family copper-binding protein [Candidatus Sulfopaludibacter sp.]
MQKFHSISRRAASLLVAAFLAGAGTSAVSATQWQALVGAQSADLGNQALAFLPNEFWIHAGDSIRFTFSTSELHTVTFLKPGQTRPPLNSPVTGNFVGCPGTTADGSGFDGSLCVSSGPSTTGLTYTVNFPSANNFKLVCLVHTRMTGAIHVLPLSAPLPYDQAFYDRQAGIDRAGLLADAIGLEGLGYFDALQTAHEVTAGISAVLATGGGSETTSVMRFLGPTMVVHVGDTVEWTNLATPPFHTITFGTEPANLMPPSPGVTLDPDGVRHGVVGSVNDSVNSGFIGAPNQETVLQPQSPLDFTRFRVTFTAPGTFNYICGLHDVLGMKGTVIVH